MGCKVLRQFPAPKARKQKTTRRPQMKLTRVILLALAFAIPTAATTVASAADEPAAAGDTAKPAKGKKGKKGKKDKKPADDTKEAAPEAK